MAVNAKNRRLLFTFLAAGTGALIVEHMLKPNLKRKLRV